MSIKRQLEFLYEIGSLRNMPRSWAQYFGKDCANVLEHSFRMLIIALMIAKKEGGDTEKILKMVIIHDLAEARTLDGTIVHRQYITQDEPRAAKDALHETGLDNLLELLEDYKCRGSLEAKIVKDADCLDGDLELKEQQNHGHKLPEKLRGNRELVRSRLYTQTAKDFWDAIQTSDPDSWHLCIRSEADKTP